MYLFDLYTLKNKRLLKVIFGLGGLGLFLYAVYEVYKNSLIVELPYTLRLSFLILFILFVLLLLYSLFLEVPFKKTYGKKEHNMDLVDTGTYALCRHPGVLWFALVFITFFLGTGRSDLFLAGAVWTVMDIFYVVLQEVTIFPKMFKDYGKYQETTPFLRPTIQSIKRMFQTIGGRR